MKLFLLTVAIFAVVLKTEGFINTNFCKKNRCKNAVCHAFLGAKCISPPCVGVAIHMANGKPVKCGCERNVKVASCVGKNPCRHAKCHTSLPPTVRKSLKCWNSACGSCHAKFYISDKLVKCPEYCDLPLAPTNGKVKSLGAFSDPLVSEEIQYACKDNFELVGDVKRTCLNNQKFSGEHPSCKRICDVPEPSSNLVIKKDEVVLDGMYVTFSCNSGYVLNGAKTAKCQSDGTLSAAMPSCEKGCNVPKLANGKSDPVKDTIIVGEEIKYSCNQGYYMLLPYTTNMKCFGDGKLKSTDRFAINLKPRCARCICSNNDGCKNRRCERYPEAKECTCNCNDFVFKVPTTDKTYNSRQCMKPTCFTTCSRASCPNHLDAKCSINDKCQVVFTDPKTGEIYNTYECRTGPLPPTQPCNPSTIDLCRIKRCANYPEADQCHYNRMTCQYTFSEKDETGKVMAVYTEDQCRKLMMCKNHCLGITCRNHIRAVCSVNQFCQRIFTDTVNGKVYTESECLI